MTIPEIITALCKATKPSRDLDAEIALCVGAIPPDYTRRGDFATWWDDHTGFYWESPFYTDSIDVALTLVPKVWDWVVDSACYSSCWKPVGKSLIECDIEVEGYGATPAISLCITALKLSLRGSDDRIRG